MKDLPIVVTNLSPKTRLDKCSTASTRHIDKRSAARAPTFLQTPPFRPVVVSRANGSSQRTWRDDM